MARLRPQVDRRDLRCGPARDRVAVADGSLMHARCLWMELRCGSWIELLAYDILVKAASLVLTQK